MALGKQLGAGAPAPLRQRCPRPVPGPRAPRRLQAASGVLGLLEAQNNPAKHLKSVHTIWSGIFLAERPLGRPVGPPVGPFRQEFPNHLAFRIWARWLAAGHPAVQGRPGTHYQHVFARSFPGSLIVGPSRASSARVKGAEAQPGLSPGSLAEPGGGSPTHHQQCDPCRVARRFAATGEPGSWSPVHGTPSVTLCTGGGGTVPNRAAG